MLQLTLRDPGNDIGAKFFSREVLEGKDKQIGWVHMTMVKFPVVRQIIHLAANVPSSAGTPMHAAKETIVKVMVTPTSFSETFFTQADQPYIVEVAARATRKSDMLEGF